MHNEGLRPSGEVVKFPVKKASTIGEEVIRLAEDAIEDAIEDASARTTEETLELHRKLLAFAHRNADAYFDWLHELTTASSPSEFIAACMKYSGRQLEILRQQSRELVNLAQKAEIENMGPFGTMVGNALIGRLDLPEFPQLGRVSATLTARGWCPGRSRP
jgi:hypothetical protein